MRRAILTIPRRLFYLSFRAEGSLLSAYCFLPTAYCLLPPASCRLLGAGTLTGAGQSYLDLFGATAAERAQGVTAFELETHIWRVIRYLRAIFDVRVNMGEQSYADFLKWASAETGLSMQFIHSQCFTFFASPGYAPSYTVGCEGYAELRAEKIKEGMSEKDFNTRACEMGFYPWTIAQAKMKGFTARGSRQ